MISSANFRRAAMRANAVPTPPAPTRRMRIRAILARAASRAPVSAAAPTLGHVTATAADTRLDGLNPQQRAAPPDRLPAGSSGGRARPDPGDHVHEQGGGRDGGAGRGADRLPRAVHVADDLPLGLRPDPAPGGEAVRLPVLVLDLRPGRLPPADGAGLPRARA